MNAINAALSGGFPPVYSIKRSMEEEAADAGAQTCTGTHCPTPLPANETASALIFQPILGALDSLGLRTFLLGALHASGMSEASVPMSIEGMGGHMRAPPHPPGSNAPSPTPGYPYTTFGEVVEGWAFLVWDEIIYCNFDCEIDGSGSSAFMHLTLAPPQVPASATRSSRRPLSASRQP